MEALQFDYNTKSLKLIQTDKPKLEQDNDVIIKVIYSGVCGTDIHITAGEFPVQDKYPVTLGHEFCGEVVEIGKDVETIKIGDRVVVDPNKGCGVCRFCHEGHPHFCKNGYEKYTIGIYRNGGWANFCIAPDDQVQKIPDSVALEEAALCEPLSCIAHGWDLIGRIGNKILVQGCGIIGNLWICCLHCRGYKNVTVIEPNEARLKIVEKLDTGYILLHPDKLYQKEETEKKFDLIIDCSGYGPAIEKAFSMLDKGGKFCMFGVAPPHVSVSLKPYEVFLNEVTIIGVKTNPYSFPKALALLESMGSRYINYDNLGVRVYKLQNYQCALDELKKGTISKVLFKFD